MSKTGDKIEEFKKLAMFYNEDLEENLLTEYNIYGEKGHTRHQK